MLNDTCQWHLFHEEQRKDIQDNLFAIRLSSFILSFWFTFGIYGAPSLKDNLSYQNIMAFLISGWLRNSMLTTVDYGAFVKRLSLPLYQCDIFGVLPTFMAIHEVECLTHICIERYVVAKYITNGWSMPRWHYVLFRVLCVSFAFVYTMVPLRGAGGYAMDFICAECTMDVILPEGPAKYVAVAIFALRSIKPAGFMIVMLIWAKRLESNFTDNLNNRRQKETTQVVVWLSAVYMACLAPIAWIQGRIVLSQLLYGSGVFSMPSPFYVQLALYLHASALINSITVLLLVSPNIQEAFCSTVNIWPLGFVTDFLKKHSTSVRETNRTQD